MNRQEWTHVSSQQVVMAPATQVGLVFRTFALVVNLFHGILPAPGTGHSQGFHVAWVHTGWKICECTAAAMLFYSHRYKVDVIKLDTLISAFTDVFILFPISWNIRHRLRLIQIYKGCFSVQWIWLVSSLHHGTHSNSRILPEDLKGTWSPWGPAMVWAMMGPSQSSSWEAEEGR